MNLEEQESGFDVRMLNLDLDRSKMRLAVTSVLFAVFLVAVAIILAASGIPRLLNGSITSLQMLVLAGGVAMIAVIVAGLALGLRSKRPGAEWVRVDSSKIELLFSSHRPIQLSWSDPKLRFELHDYSAVQPDELSIEARFFLLAKGTDTALSSAAFHAIKHQIDAHGLDRRTRAPSSWQSPRGVLVDTIRRRPL